jgi:hypothetical protein
MQSSKKLRNDAPQGSVCRIGGKFPQSTTFKDSQDHSHCSRAPQYLLIVVLVVLVVLAILIILVPLLAVAVLLLIVAIPHFIVVLLLRVIVLPRSIDNTPSAEEEFCDNHKNGNGKAWGGVRFNHQLIVSARL